MLVAVLAGFVQSAVTGLILAGSFEAPSCIKVCPTAFVFFNPLDLSVHAFIDRTGA